MPFYAARQPILDQQKNLVGYELLFRTSLENIFPKVDEDKATSKMLDGLCFDMGLDKIAEGKTAFINFTKQSILQNLPVLLPKDLITIEVLETVQPSQEILDKFKLFHKHGYTLALDDFVHSPDWEPFYKYCHVIKVDCVEISDSQLHEITEVIKHHPHIKLLAEKVEDITTFERFRSLGFSLFQGYFFARPEVIKSASFSASQTSVANLLDEVSRPEVNVSRIIELFESDAALSYRLLKYVKSPIFYRRKEIESIRQAVIMLGNEELNRFVTLLFAATFAEGKPSELIRMCLQRAKFCELLSACLNDLNASSSFLLGMMSLIDAMLDADIATVVDGLPLSDDIKIALVNKRGTAATVLQICKGLEVGNFRETQALCKTISVSMADVCSMHLDAIGWADKRISVLL